VDIAGLVKGASRGEGLGNQFLGHIREVDAILHVVRCFDDQNVAHATGAPDPLRDAEIVETEFLLADLETARRGLEKRARSARTGGETGKVEQAAFSRAVEALGEGKQIAGLEWSDEERAVLAEARFLTAKPSLYVANTAESDPLGRGPLAQALREAKGADSVVAVSIGIEEEISRLAPEEQRVFLEDLGLEQTALNLVVASCYRLLDLITFYTIAHDKLSAWQLPSGGTAEQAAGKIHSDMQRGFIRAEIMGLDDLLRSGSRQALHDEGLIQVVGRDHPVRDRDVLQIHFKV
jgi:GTP-binding protein YchF